METSILFFSLCILLNQLGVKGSFTTSPIPIVQAEGLNATFYCLHPSASATGWRLNGTSVNMRHPPNVFVGTVDGESTHYLTILATSEYNETTVQCFAFVFNNRVQTLEETESVSITVQGILDEVRNITSLSLPETIAIIWEPPFSLNLTKMNVSSPNIVYCVQVFNITKNMNQTGVYLIRSDYNVLEPRYTFTTSEPDPTYLFEVVIIPRSNVRGAINGTPSEPVEVYFNVQPRICADSVGLEIRSDDLKFVTYPPKWVAEIFITITIWSIDDERHQIHCDCFIITSPTANDNCTECSKFILRNRAYMVRVKCQNEIGTAELERSTHGIINSSFSKNLGNLIITCHFSVSSSDKGCFIVTQRVEIDTFQPLLQYNVAYRNNDQLMASTILNGLPPGTNKVYLFEIERNGLPGRYPALNTSVVILEDSQTTTTTFSNEAFTNTTFTSIPRQNCILYSLKNYYIGSTVIHVPCISDGLLNLISVHFFNAPMDTICLSFASECSHSVAVFGVGKNGTLDLSTTKSFIVNQSEEIPARYFPNNKEKCHVNSLSIILGSLLAVCMLLLALVLTVCLLKLYCSRKCRSNSQLSVARSNSDVVQSDYDVGISLHKCEAYETVANARSRHILSGQ